MWMVAAVVVLVCKCSVDEIANKFNMRPATVDVCFRTLEENKAELLRDVRLPTEPVHMRYVAAGCVDA